MDYLSSTLGPRFWAGLNDHSETKCLAGSFDHFIDLFLNRREAWSSKCAALKKLHEYQLEGSG